MIDDGASSSCADVILNAESSCILFEGEAVCVMAMRGCNDGFDNCDGNPANGCEESFCTCNPCESDASVDDAGADDGGAPDAAD